MASRPMAASMVRGNPVETPILHLLGGPYVTVAGKRREVPEGSKRLLAFVALHPMPVRRRRVAGSIWPDADEVRASGNLRSALWRLRTAGIHLVSADKSALALSERVRVDVRAVSEWASRLIRGQYELGDLTIPPRALEALDLLPGWYDDWVMLERERLRQRVLHALEALSCHLTAMGRWAEAVEVAMTAVAAEPLRESAQRTLIDAHLAEGNWVEARRTYETYRNLLWNELGVEPAPDLSAKVAAPLGGGWRRSHPA